MAIETNKNYSFNESLATHKSASNYPLLSYFRGKTFQIQENGKNLYISKKKFFDAYSNSSGIEQEKISNAFNKAFKRDNSWISFFCKKSIVPTEEQFKQQLKVEIASNEILEIMWPGSKTVSPEAKKALKETLNTLKETLNKWTIKDNESQTAVGSKEQILERVFLTRWRTELNTLNQNQTTEESKNLTSKITKLNLSIKQQNESLIGIHPILDKFSPPERPKIEEETAQEKQASRNLQVDQLLRDAHNLLDDLKSGED